MLNKFELKYAHRIIRHAQIQFNPHLQRKTTAFIHACIHLTCSSIPLTEIKIAEVKWIKSLIL